jgi:hypothetical protein
MPIAKHIMLETKARTNQSTNENMNCEGIADINLTVKWYYSCQLFKSVLAKPARRKKRLFQSCLQLRK